MKTLTVRDPVSGEKRRVIAHFTEEELAALRDYVLAANELREARYLREPKQASLKLEWKEGAGLRVTTDLPPSEVCDSLLLRMRPFVLQVERTNLPNISALLGRRLDDPTIHTMLRSYRDLWEGKYLRAMITVSDSFGILNTDQSLMDYLNAFHYHRDRKKQARLDGMRQMIGDQGLRAFFMLLMVEKVKAVLQIAELCSVLLGDTRELSLTFERPIRERL